METALSDTGGWPAVLSSLIRREDLTSEVASAAFDDILSGGATPAQIGAFAAALRSKGETVEEMTAFIGAMRRHGEGVDAGTDVLDTCGTGGDRSGTINVSTIAALIAAGAGAVVCKHGGRAASSQAGSADVLEALGVAIDLGPREVEACIKEAGIGFCLAPRFHPAMRHVAPLRRELGVATVFNFLGPLANPARATRQLLGVSDPTMADKMLSVLEATGSEHAMVVYGHDGLDEISTTTTSTIVESVRDPGGGHRRSVREVAPESLGIARASLGALAGGDASRNAALAREVLAGAPGPARDVVCLNAAAALVVAGLAVELAEGLEIARSTVDSGRAMAALERLVEVSQRLFRKTAAK